MDEFLTPAAIKFLVACGFETAGAQLEQLELDAEDLHFGHATEEDIRDTMYGYARINWSSDGADAYLDCVRKFLD
jgi:hypothetical protein